MLRCQLSLKPMPYGGVYNFSAEVLRPEVCMTALKDAEVVTITFTPNKALPHIGRQLWRNAKDDRCNLPALL